jgi:hypothetical protein
MTGVKLGVRQRCDRRHRKRVHTSTPRVVVLRYISLVAVEETRHGGGLSHTTSGTHLGSSVYKREPFNKCEPSLRSWILTCVWQNAKRTLLSEKKFCCQY